MKTIIATAAIALSLTAPSFADVSDAQAFFALTNDSPAENIVRSTSIGDVAGAQIAGALANDSAAESQVHVGATQATRGDSNLLRFFALTNDSAAERIVK